LTPEFWALAEAGDLRVDTAPTDLANLRKPLKGRIDLYPMSAQGGWHLIENSLTDAEQAQLTTVRQPLQVTHGYLLLSRAVDGAEQIAQRLSAALAQLTVASSLSPQSAQNTTN